MIRVKCEAVTFGSCLGEAAILMPPYFIPEPPARYLRSESRVRLGEPVDKVDTILVCPKMTQANSVQPPWATVVGIWVEEIDAAPLRPNIPVLVGPTTAAIHSGSESIIVLDSGTGTATVDPDPLIIADYQNQITRLSARTRIFLDEQDQVACTQSGIPVRVGAYLTDIYSFEMAKESGCDFFVTNRNDPLLLFSISEYGKPISILTDLEEIEIEHLLTLSLSAEISVFIPEIRFDDTVFLLTEEFNKALEDLISLGKVGRIPKYGQVVDFASDHSEEEINPTVGRMITTIHELDNEASKDELINLKSITLTNGIALEVLMDTWSPELIHELLIAQVNAIIVPPERVKETKSIIRQTEPE